MRTLSAALFLTLAMVCAATAQGATYEVPALEGDHILLKGLAAQVQFIAQPGAKSVKVSGLDEGSQAGHYSLFKKGNLIEVRMGEFDDKASWKNALSKSAGLMRKIEVIGPSLPLEVHLRDGTVTLQRWTREAKVSVIQGRVNSQNGAGALQISVQKGDIMVGDHKGKVSTDSYSGNTGIKNVQGDVEAQLFSGQLVIEKVKGFVVVGTQQATGKVVQSSGSLQIDNGKGSLTVQAFQGRIEGQTTEGPLTVSFLPESEINLKSKSGRIHIQAPANSGASLNLLTVDGEIDVPREVRVVRLSSEKSVRGRLRGETQKGSIVVRSQEGSIIVK
jgi:DUF4097 and DUF4098 domain-containing protein YvlB